MRGAIGMTTQFLHNLSIDKKYTTVTALPFGADAVPYGVKSVNSAGDIYYLTMDWVTGGSLKTELMSDSIMGLAKVVKTVSCLV